MGRVYRSLGHYDRARDLLERAVAEGTDDVWISKLELIRTLQLAKDLPSAKEWLDGMKDEVAAAVNPVKIALYHHALGYQLFLTQDHPGSLAAYEKAMVHFGVLEKKQQMALHRDQAALWSATGRHDQAIEVLTQLLEQNRDLYGEDNYEVAQILSLLGDQFAAKGDEEKAATWHNQAKNILSKLYASEEDEKM